MQAQKIRPQTMTPSASAVTPDHVHSTRIRVACLVTPVGQPNRRLRSQSLAEQPVRTTAIEPRRTAMRPPRAQPLRRTCQPPLDAFETVLEPTGPSGARPDGGTRLGAPRPRRRRYRRLVPAFLDAAAGAPLHPAARTALLAALDDGWADPARLYGAGRRARLLLDAARESMAESLGARPDEISFAANATQALQAAVLGTLAGNRGDAFVHSAVEHSAVLHSAASADRPVLVPVDRLGRVGVEEFVAAAGAGGVAGAAL